MPWGTSGWYTVATAKPLTTALPPVINATAKRLTKNASTNFNDKSDKSHVNNKQINFNSRNNRAKVTKETDGSSSSNQYFHQGHHPKLIDSVFSGSLYKNPYECNCDGKSKSNTPSTSSPQAPVDEEEEEEDADGTTNQQETSDNGDDNRPSETLSVNDFDDDEHIESEQSSQDVKRRKQKRKNKKSRLQRATAKILQSTNPSSLEFLCEQFIQVNDLTFNHTLGRFIASSPAKFRKNGKIKRKKSSKSSSSSGKISKNGKTRSVKQSNQLDKTLQLVEREGPTDSPAYTSSIGQFLATTTKLPVASRKSRHQSPLVQTNRFSSVADSWTDKYDGQTTGPAGEDDDGDDNDREQDDDTDDTTEATTRSGRTSTTASDRFVEDQWNQQQKEKGEVKGGRSRPRVTSGAVKGRSSGVKKPLRERD